MTPGPSDPGPDPPAAPSPGPTQSDRKRALPLGSSGLVLGPGRAGPGRGGRKPLPFPGPPAALPSGFPCSRSRPGQSETPTGLRPPADLSRGAPWRPQEPQPQRTAARGQMWPPLGGACGAGGATCSWLWGCLCVTPSETVTPNTTTNCSGPPGALPWGNISVPEQESRAEPLKSASATVETNRTAQLPWLPLSVLWVQPGPTSLTVTVGSLANLRCEFQPHLGVSLTVTWSRVCSTNCSEPPAIVNGSDQWVSVDEQQGTSLLTFSHASKEHTGLYYCRVEAGGMRGQSCGTYLRVRNPMPTSFLNMRESTKNQIITAEGILLLFCAVGPGLFLLFRKRWANERLLQAKKSAYEEENLYEGLNLDDCSMYEDISRGLQSTYQDVANIHGSDIQLEKP